MDDEERRGTIRKLIEAQNAGDLSAFEAIYHDDLVVEWPQSGEVVHGKENLLALRQGFPTPPTASLRRITGSGDLWVIEMTFGYGEDTYHVAVIHEYRDGKVARETSYTARRSSRRTGGASGWKSLPRRIVPLARPRARHRGQSDDGCVPRPQRRWPARRGLGLGVLRGLSDGGVDLGRFERVIGTSAGAIAGALLTSERRSRPFAYNRSQAVRTPPAGRR